jgi:hypothetical protein
LDPGGWVVGDDLEGKLGVDSTGLRRWVKDSKPSGVSLEEDVIFSDWGEVTIGPNELLDSLPNSLIELLAERERCSIVQDEGEDGAIRQFGSAEDAGEQPVPLEDSIIYALQSTTIL